MRTVTFQRVFNRIVRKHGRNPLKEIPPDMARAILEPVNDRVRTICNVWPWPEWELTEERAFRQVWNDSRQFLRSNMVDGTPDEVFYIPNTTYYRVLASAAADPPIGGLPTDTTYWEVMDTPIDTYIEYAQVCRREIGMAVGVYSQNPRLNKCSDSGLLCFHPSEKGIDVCNPTGPTVFITYKMPVPEYTIVPYVVGRLYSRGEIVFDPTIGECFQALTTTAALPADTDFWRRVPFLQKWFEYVAESAFADSLFEFDQGGNQDFQVKALLSQRAEQKANDALQLEVDTLASEGQKLRYNFCKRNVYWCETQPWSGGTVSTLTDECQDELGWVYPTPTVVPQVTWRYYDDIVALKAATASPSLDQVATQKLLPKSIAQLMILEGGYRTSMQWELVTGTANSANPGHVAPLDYNNISNVKYWERRT